MDQLLRSPGDILGLLLEGDLRHTGATDVNGRPAAVYIGKVSGKRLREIMESTGTLGTMSEALSLDLPEVVLDELSDMDVTIRIDEQSGLPIGCTVDMTGAMGDLMTAILTADKEAGGVEIRMDVTAAVLNMTLSDFDAVEPIVIPEDALNAPGS